MAAARPLAATEVCEADRPGRGQKAFEVCAKNQLGWREKQAGLEEKVGGVTHLNFTFVYTHLSLSFIQVRKRHAQSSRTYSKQATTPNEGAQQSH